METPDCSLISSNPYLCRTGNTLREEQKATFSTMWELVRDKSGLNLASEANDSLKVWSSRKYQLESTIGALLTTNVDDGPSAAKKKHPRPSMKQIELHCSANLVRSKLSEDKVRPALMFTYTAVLHGSLSGETGWN
jgi:hypothetical protein